MLEAVFTVSINPSASALHPPFPFLSILSSSPLTTDLQASTLHIITRTNLSHPSPTRTCAVFSQPRAKLAVTRNIDVPAISPFVDACGSVASGGSDGVATIRVDKKRDLPFGGVGVGWIMAEVSEGGDGE